MKPAKLALLIAKWMVVPILCGLAGYYIVAPRFGVVAEPEPVNTIPTQESPIAENPAPGPRNFAEPEVAIEVKKPTRSTEFKRRKKKKAPEEKPPEPDTPAETQA